MLYIRPCIRFDSTRMISCIIKIEPVEKSRGQRRFWRRFWRRLRYPRQTRAPRRQMPQMAPYTIAGMPHVPPGHILKRPTQKFTFRRLNTVRGIFFWSKNLRLITAAEKTSRSFSDKDNWKQKTRNANISAGQNLNEDHRWNAEWRQNEQNLRREAQNMMKETVVSCECRKLVIIKLEWQIQQSPAEDNIFLRLPWGTSKPSWLAIIPQRWKIIWPWSPWTSKLRITRNQSQAKGSSGPVRCDCHGQTCFCLGILRSEWYHKRPTYVQPKIEEQLYIKILREQHYKAKEIAD